MKYIIERWTGKGWDASMCSPYSSMKDVNEHLKKYWWHYNDNNPYRVKEVKK